MQTENLSNLVEHSKQWQPQQTGDGSFTFYSTEFQEAFHSQQGARTEAFAKYAIATDLPRLAQRLHLCLLDVCYGLGYNTAAALETIWAIHPQCQVTVYALELDATVPVAAIQPPVLDSWTPPVREILQELAIAHQSHRSNFSATLLIGDARQTIQQLRAENLQASAIFFDPFSPRRCPQMWTVELMHQVAQCLAPDGRLATYSRSASVRAAMLAAGLHIGTIPQSDRTAPRHEWAQGTVAGFNPTLLPPLSLMEQEHLHTRAAIPYRDPTLMDTAAMILARQQHMQSQSLLESTSSWRRRWQLS